MTTFRPLVVVLAGVAVMIPAVVIVTAAASMESNTRTHLTSNARADLLQLTRGLAVPSGVSPVLAMVFLGVAGCAWVYAQLKRRFVFDQFTPESAPVQTIVIRPDETGEEKILREVRERRRRFEEILSSPGRTFFQGQNLIPVIVFVLSIIYFVAPLPYRSVFGQGKTYDGPVFDITASLVFASLFTLLSFHLIQLVMLWFNAQGLMKHLIRLPLASALDRMPARVAHWFQESPGPEADRFDLLQRQALALADACEEADSAVLRELQDALKKAFRPAEAKDARIMGRLRVNDKGWATLVRGLKSLERDRYMPVRDRLVKILLIYWRPLPIAAVYPDAQGVGKPATTEEGGPPKRLPDWVRLAEDLMALMFMRWLAAALAQVWGLIGFLVVGSLSLLLAVNSYPFPYQERLMLGLGLLIGALVVTILMIVLGFNRDELISRIANTAPNQTKFNQNLVGGVLTYIVPLVGLLAAFSFDTSDTLRSLLDPVLRHMR